MTKKKADPATATQPQGRKVAILGTASTSIHQAPYNDPAWKIWDMSANFQYGKRFDLWFEVHTPDTLMVYPTAEHYVNHLIRAGKAVIALHPSPVWPCATPYPIQDVLEQFGDYFVCTAAYMLAFALLEHLKETGAGGPGIAEVGMWGIDMSAEGSEYSRQKPNVEYWVGRLRQAGIKVSIANNSPLCRVNAMYGFENVKLAREFTEKLLELNTTIPQLEKEVETKNRMIIELKAVRRELQSISDRWCL